MITKLAPILFHHKVFVNTNSYEETTTNMRILTLIMLFFISLTKLNAQFDENYRKQPVHYYDSSKFDAGFGFGLDYGGTLGVKFTYLPTKWLGIFGAVGLYFYETGYSVGLQFKLPTEKRISGYLTGMYGTNGGLDIDDGIYTKQYYGATIGSGIEIKTKKDNIFWNLELIMPFRDDQLQKDVDEFKSNGLTVLATTWVVNFSIGFHIKL